GAHRALARTRGGIRGPAAGPGGGRGGRGPMRGFWMLVHVLGFTLWLGGGIATMVAGVAAKRLGAAERLAGYRLIGAVQRLLVAPGAVAVVVSGVLLSMPYMKQGDVPGWMGLMMVAGLAGALGAVGVGGGGGGERADGGAARAARARRAGRPAGGVSPVAPAPDRRRHARGLARPHRDDRGDAREVVARRPVLQTGRTGHSGHLGRRAVQTSAPSSMIA